MCAPQLGAGISPVNADGARLMSLSGPIVVAHCGPGFGPPREGRKPLQYNGLRELIWQWPSGPPIFNSSLLLTSNITPTCTLRCAINAPFNSLPDPPTCQYQSAHIAHFAHYCSSKTDPVTLSALRVFTGKWVVRGVLLAVTEIHIPCFRDLDR